LALLVYASAALDSATLDALQQIASHPLLPEVVLVTAPGVTLVTPWRVLQDSTGRVAERFDAAHGTTYLIRPDQHVAARMRKADAQRLTNALARATANTEVEAR